MYSMNVKSQKLIIELQIELEIFQFREFKCITLIKNLIMICSFCWIMLNPYKQAHLV